MNPSEQYDDNPDSNWGYIVDQILYWMEQRQELGLALKEFRAPAKLIARMDEKNNGPDWRHCLLKSNQK